MSLNRAFEINRKKQILENNIRQWNKERLEATKNQKVGTMKLRKLSDELTEELTKQEKTYYKGDL